MFEYSTLSLRIFGFITLFLISSSSFAQLKTSKCDLDVLQKLESKFDALALKQVSSTDATLANELTSVARKYLSMNNSCFDELYKKGAQSNGDNIQVDEGGLWFDSSSKEVESSEFNSFGTKWGAGSPYTGGQDVNRPGISGGVVTYSFMPTGVSNAVERAFDPSVDSNLSFSSLPTYQPCFETEIVRALAMWSAVADIKFKKVSDNGVASNASGATGDIRIGAHSIDGGSDVLAHAFFAPPNGDSIAGDMHFDRVHNWSCTPSSGSFDIGIVAAHEFGHSIGLNHQADSRVALMNPFYNPGIVSALTQDDVNGAIAIYGPATIVASPSIIMAPVNSLLLDE